MHILTAEHKLLPASATCQVTCASHCMRAVPSLVHKQVRPGICASAAARLGGQLSGSLCISEQHMQGA